MEREGLRRGSLAGSALGVEIGRVVVEQQVPVEVEVTRLVEVEKEVEVTREVVVEVAPAFDAAAEEAILQGLADGVHRAFQEADIEALKQYLAADSEFLTTIEQWQGRLDRHGWLAPIYGWTPGGLTITVHRAEWMVAHFHQSYVR